MAEGEGAQSGAEGTQSGTEESTTGNTSGTNAATGTEAGAQSGTNTEAERAKAEADNFRERMRAADQRAAKFEQELKQLRDKDLPEAEKQQKDLAEANKRVETLETTNRDLALKVAFLSDNSVTWHNPDRALRLVDLSQVTIDEDGAVHGLKEALNALAKSDSYLIKTDKEEKTPPPGTSPGNNGSSGTAKPKAGALASRLPVMNTRVRPQ